MPGTPRVAFVHDHLVQRGGSERVLVSMLRAFPDAPVFTSFFWPEATYPELGRADVRCLAVDRVPGLRRRHRAAFPLLPWFFSQLEVDADVVVCSSSGWAQGARARGGKIVFFHALAHWLHTPVDYAAGDSTARRLAVRTSRPILLRWDRRAALSAQRFLVSGPTMQARVARVYGVQADVLPPPAALDPREPGVPLDGLTPGFFLSAARLMPYKNLGAVVAAFAQLPDHRLVVAGEGPDGRRLRAAAPANVQFVGTADDAHLRWLYANCRALVCAGFESYGLTPLEGAAFAKPTVALREGGLADVVVEGSTGEFFERAEPAAIGAAVRRLDGRRYPAEAFRRISDTHTVDGFVSGLRRIVEEERTRAGAVPSP